MICVLFNWKDKGMLESLDWYRNKNSHVLASFRSSITRFIELKINQFIVACSNFFVPEYSFRKLAMYGTGFTTIVLPFQKGDYLCCHEKS